MAEKRNWIVGSSLGSALGVAISGSIFTAISSTGVPWLEGVIPFPGRQDNLAVRQAAMVALGFNGVMVALAALSVVLTIPKGKRAEPY